ncbi:MAG: hypothetical protein UW65_C0004G0001, partial [candidate division WWE3 bacterium GW2011_GWB1_44_4]
MTISSGLRTEIETALRGVAQLVLVIQEADSRGSLIFPSTTPEN